jgi:hypothetical protein
VLHVGEQPHTAGECDQPDAPGRSNVLQATGSSATVTPDRIACITIGNPLPSKSDQPRTGASVGAASISTFVTAIAAHVPTTTSMIRSMPREKALIGFDNELNNTMPKVTHTNSQAWLHRLTLKPMLPTTVTNKQDQTTGDRVIGKPIDQQDGKQCADDGA